MRTITITGSEGLIGNQLSKYFENGNKVYRLDVKLGHDLTNEKFVKKWFRDNPTDYLINCFAINDHVSKIRKKRTLYNFTTDEFLDYLNINLIALFLVCREFARSNRKGAIVNFSSTYGLVSPHPDLYDGSHKDIGYCVSKAGVINMTKYLAVHLAPKIRVNCLVPGGMLFKQDKKFIYSSIKKFTI